MRPLLAIGLALALIAPASAQQAPPLEPIETERMVALDEFGPDGYDIISLEWAPDYEHVVAGVKLDGAEHIAVANLDGTDFRCVTCDLVPNANKIEPLEDGQRIWFASNDSQGRDQTEVVPGAPKVPLPGQGGTGDFQWYMLECSPSIYDCQQRAVLDVQFPIDSLAEGAQNREAKPDPLGDFVAWNEVRSTEGTRMTVARLVRGASEYTLIEPRVFNEPYDTSGDPRTWIPGSRFYEGASWVAGNRMLKYQTTTTAVNYDTYLLDIETGERRQITTDLDYNEIADYPLNGTWGAISSARGLDRMDIFTQLVRPAFLDMVSFGQVGRVGLWNNRRCMNELWLWDWGYGQRLGGYSGQPIRFEDDWTVRDFQWLPDGTRALAREELIPNHPDPADPERRVRYRIVRLPARSPQPSAETLRIDPADVQTWSVPAGQYQGMAARQEPERVIEGPGGGTATLRYAGTFAAGRWEVRFERWSDDGRSFVTGTETLTTPNPIVLATWTADLLIEGEHEGFLRGTAHVGPQNTFQADVVSEVDGRRYERVPTQADCPGLLQAPLVIEDLAATSEKPGRSKHRPVTVTGYVRAVIPEDGERRPVRRATVTVADRVASTGPDGAFSVSVPAAANYTVRAEAATFRPTTAATP